VKERKGGRGMKESGDLIGPPAGGGGREIEIAARDGWR